LYNEHRRQAWQDIQSSKDNFDKNLLTLSSAALGVSLIFIKDIILLQKAGWLWLLYTSWISFSGCILVTVASFQVSIVAQHQYLEYLWHYYILRDPKYFNKQKRSGPSKALTWMTWAASALFILGIASTLVFCCENASRRSSMTDSKTVPVKEARAPFNMTPTLDSVGEQRGRQPVEMTPVVPQTQPPVSTQQDTSGGNGGKKE
jgi:hypothetical protein